MTDDVKTATRTTSTGRINDQDEHPLVRAMDKAAKDTKTRWATYDLPPVTPLSRFANYAEASTKRHHIALERTAAETDLRKSVTAIARGMAALREDETERQAQDILAGRPDQAFEGFEELKAKVTRLTQKSKGYAAALRIQDELVASIRSELSIDAATAMAPTHREVVASIAELVAQLRTALDKEEAVRTAVTQEGYDARLPSFATAGLFGNNSQRLDDLERRAREYVR